MKIVLDDDPDYYYEGRAMVDEWASEELNSLITIKLRVNPYKKKKRMTVVSRDVTGKAVIICNNLRQHVIPLVKTSTKMKITYDGTTIDAEAGSHIFDFFLKEGENEFTVQGNGTIAFEYQEGSL